MTYDEAVNLWGRRVADDRGVAVADDAEFEIEADLDSGGCPTCGPDNRLTLQTKGHPYRVIAEYGFYQMGDILREIWSVDG